MAWQPIRAFLPRESHGQRSLADYSLQGYKESDMTEVTWHARTYTCVNKATRIYCLAQRSQEIPGVTGKFSLGVQNEAGQRLTVLPRERTGHSKHPFPKTQEETTHRYHQMVNTKIRLIIFFAAKDREALYSQQKQDRELTVAQIINYLMPNSDLN